MNFIKELYFGNISPGEQTIITSSDYKKLEKSCDILSEELKKEMSEENASKFDRLDNVHSDLITITAEENYVQGFRDGAKLMLDVLTGENKNLQPLMKRII